MNVGCPHRAFCFAVAVCVLGTLAVIARGAAGAEQLPRYKLVVGQELLYRTTEGKYPVEWTINVIGRNPDGSWRLAFRQKQNFGGTDRTADGYFDLAADGRLIESRTLGPMANPTAVFPPLPPDEVSLSASWSATLALDDTRRVLKAAGDESAAKNEWLFVEQPQTVFDPIYLVETRREYVFDRDQGLVRKFTTTSKQGWPKGLSENTSTSTVELADSRQLPKSKADAMADDFNQYFAAREAYDKLVAQASYDFEHTEELLDQARAELMKLKGELKVTTVQTMLENKLSQDASSRSYLLENAERFGKLLNKPSADWQTTDLEGNKRTLEDYRGQVVLMDFWYRGCGWCIRAMPQIKQLVNDFDGQKVAVLGMNNDRNLDDAHFVIDKLGLNYPTLKNGDGDDAINTKYGVQGWPTLVVLDGKGVVRHIHVGYSPTLRDDLAKKIRELLAEK